jgi:hypothetical protein
MELSHILHFGQAKGINWIKGVLKCQTRIYYKDQILLEKKNNWTFVNQKEKTLLLHFERDYATANF